MIKEYEFYHGVVFTKLIHETDGPLKISTFQTSSNASYIMNDKIGLYIKHSTKRLTPWQFSFHIDHQEEIKKMREVLADVFLLLVCGRDGVLSLSYDELKMILDERHETMEWVRISRLKNHEYSVSGSDGGLGKKIGKSDFPKKILKCIKMY